MASSQIWARSLEKINIKKLKVTSFAFSLYKLNSKCVVNSGKTKGYVWSHYTYFTLGIKDEELVLWFQQFARISYVDSCLLLVPSQHADLDSGFVKSFYRLRYSLLQPVFNASSTWKNNQIATRLIKNQSQLKLILSITTSQPWPVQWWAIQTAEIQTRYKDPDNAIYKGGLWKGSFRDQWIYQSYCSLSSCLIYKLKYLIPLFV